MAEFVVFNKMNWMDMPSRVRPDLTGYVNVKRKIEEAAGPGIEAQTVRLFELFKMDKKYEMRYQRGDVVEVRRDNGPRGSKEPESFAFISVPIDLATAKQYKQIDRDGDDIKHNRKYWIDMTGLVLDKDKQAELTLGEFNNRLKVKK